MERIHEGRFARVCRRQSAVLLSFFLAFTFVVHAQDGIANWQQNVQHLLKEGKDNEAFAVVENRLKESPEDLEAHGWRGRLLARRGNFQESETEYRFILRSAPKDTEILSSLADVLLWQREYESCLQILNQASEIEPSNPEILSRRARVLFLLNRATEARAQYRSILLLNPSDQNARAALSEIAAPNRQELRIGEELGILSYAKNTQSQITSLTSRWNQRWTTWLAVNSYEMFGEEAVRAGGGVALHFRKSDWARIEAGVANPQNITSQRDALLEYGHGFQFSNRAVRGLEFSYQQRWLWYRGARVFTFGSTQIFYLPRAWQWALTLTGARTCFPSKGCAVVPSGITKLTFPLMQALSGNVLYAVGSENFSQVNQIGRISAPSYGGGISYHVEANQDVITSLVIQRRPLGQTQISIGMTYGIRF